MSHPPSSSPRPQRISSNGGRHGAIPDSGLKVTVNVPCPLALLLLVDEVAARSVGAVAVDPILLAVLGLVLVVPHNIFLKLKYSVNAVTHGDWKSEKLMSQVPELT